MKFFAPFIFPAWFSWNLFPSDLATSSFTSLWVMLSLFFAAGPVIVVSSTYFQSSTLLVSISSIISMNIQGPCLVPCGTPAEVSLHSNLQSHSCSIFCLINPSNLFQYTPSKHIHKKIRLLIIHCLSNAIFLLYLYLFLDFACQSIEYYVTCFVFRFPRALYMYKHFLRAPTFFIFAVYFIYSCFRICL